MNEDLALQKLVNLEQDMTLVKRKIVEHDDKFDRILGNQDQMIGLMQKWDQERIFMNQKITELDRDVTGIKLRLQTANIV